MAFIDGLIALGILGIFFIYVGKKLMENNPRFGEFMGGFFKGGLITYPPEPKLNEEEDNKWKEHITTL